MNQADTIRRKLREIEAANQVKILYAVESGSRAWGFASRTATMTCDMCLFAQ